MGAQKIIVNVLKSLPALTKKTLFWKGTEDSLRLNPSFVSKFKFVCKFLHQSNTQKPLILTFLTLLCVMKS